MSLVLHRSSARLRREVRGRVPFNGRLALLRAPHLLRWALTPPGRLPTAPEFSVYVCKRNSPMRRSGTLYDPTVQAAKEQNVARAASALHGRVLEPGERLSWHDHVGPPVVGRGFADGPELHDDAVALGLGGGVCQVANLVYWLAVHGGLLILERHRHAQDLFPDDQRNVPFGLGATVFWPFRDLVIANPHRTSVRLGLRVHDGVLIGRLTSTAALGAVWGVREEGHRFVERGGVVFRENRLFRWCETTAGNHSEAILAEHSARVAYSVPVEQVEEA